LTCKKNGDLSNLQATRRKDRPMERCRGALFSGEATLEILHWRLQLCEFTMVSGRYLYSTAPKRWKSVSRRL
jgi:hypothetical protein